MWKAHADIHQDPCLPVAVCASRADSPVPICAGVVGTHLSACNVLQAETSVGTSTGREPASPAGNTVSTSFGVTNGATKGVTSPNLLVHAASNQANPKTEGRWRSLANTWAQCLHSYSTHTRQDGGMDTVHGVFVRNTNIAWCAVVGGMQEAPSCRCVCNNTVAVCAPVRKDGQHLGV
jgi:hypothetical protein